MTKAKNPEDYAIVIGIHRYAQLVPPLESAAKDAHRFHEWLLKPEGGGLDPAHVRLLIDKKYADQNQDVFPAEYKPNPLTVDAELQGMRVDQKQRIGRRLYFYFSGHGVGIGPNDVAMLMTNAAEGRMVAAHLGLSGYRDWLHNAAAFDELVFILDCCRNRVAPPRVITGPSFDPFTRDPDFKNVKPLTVLATLDGDRAFDAVNPGMESSPMAKERRGLLTEALLQGLDERLAADSTGAITASSLATYIKKRVGELAEAHGLDQEARVPDPPEGIIFGPIIPPTAPTAPMITFQITIPPGLEGSLRLTRGSRPEAPEPHDASISPWVFTGPRNDFYFIDHPPSGRTQAIRPQDIQGENHAITF